MPLKSTKLFQVAPFQYWWVYGLGATWNNFVDFNGIPTNIGMVQPVKVDGMVTPGVQTGNNSGIFPDKVMYESFGMFPGDTTWVVLNGLDVARTYDITIFASLTNYVGDNTSVYLVNGQTCLLNSLNNKTGTLTIYGIVPDATGQVKLSFTGYPTATFGLLGAMIVRGYDASTNPIPQPPVTLMTNSNVVTGQAAQFVPMNNTILNRPLMVYPNPFDSYFNLSVPAKGNDKVMVIITDNSGRTLYRKQFEGLYDGTNLLRIQPLQPLNAAVYYVTVINPASGEMKTIKVVKR
jgi:hypothetical protein